MKLPFSIAFVNRFTAMLFAFFFGNIFMSFGQKVWTLQDCIDFALENNIQVKREKLKTIRQDNLAKQAKWNLLPDLNARYVHEYRIGYSINEFLYNYDSQAKNYGYMGVESEVTLFNGFRNFNEIKKQELELEKSLADYHEFRNSIILKVASGYLEVLLNKEILEMAKNQLAITTLQVGRTRKLVEVGNLANGELSKIKALEANDKLSVVQSQNRLDIAYLNLAQLLELESNAGFEIFTPELNTIGLFQLEDIDKVYINALEFLPDIASMEIDVQSKEQSLKVERGKAYPELRFRVNLNSWYMKTAADSLDQLYMQANDHKETVYSLDLAIPIFNKLQTSRNVSNARIDLLDAQYKLEHEKKELYKHIQQAHTDAVGAYNKYTTAQEAVKANEEAFQYTEQKFNVGLVTSVDYNLATNELLKAKAELLISKYEYIFKAKILNFYSGKPFTL